MAEERVEVRYVARRIKLIQKSCVVCGAAFEATARRLYCSNRCQQKVSYDRHRERRLAEQRERYVARKLPTRLDAGS
jgi:predicted nucleic acid-binding Zn ribbon protein